jgi:hypothetical protein
MFAQRASVSSMDLHPLHARFTAVILGGVVAGTRTLAPAGGSAHACARGSELRSVGPPARVRSAARPAAVATGLSLLGAGTVFMNRDHRVERAHDRDVAAYGERRRQGERSRRLCIRRSQHRDSGVHLDRRTRARAERWAPGGSKHARRARTVTRGSRWRRWRWKRGNGEYT